MVNYVEVETGTLINLDQVSCIYTTANALMFMTQHGLLKQVKFDTVDEVLQAYKNLKKEV